MTNKKKTARDDAQAALRKIEKDLETARSQRTRAQSAIDGADTGATLAAAEGDERLISRQIEGLEADLEQAHEHLARISADEAAKRVRDRASRPRQGLAHVLDEETDQLAAVIRRLGAAIDNEHAITDEIGAFLQDNSVPAFTDVNGVTVQPITDGMSRKRAESGYNVRIDGEWLGTGRRHTRGDRTRERAALVTTVLRAALSQSGYQMPKQTQLSAK